MEDTANQELKGVNLILPLLKHYSRGYKGIIVLGIIAGALSAMTAGFGLPYMVNKVFPLVFDSKTIPEELRQYLLSFVSPENMDHFILWGAAFLLPITMGIRGMAGFFNSYLLTRAGVGMLTALRTDIFVKLQSLSLSFHDRHRRGELMTMVVQYTQGAQQAMINIVNDLVLQPLTLLAAFAYLVYAALQSEQNAMLLGTLVITSLCVPLVRLVGRRVIVHMRKALYSMAQLTTCLEESLSAQREVRAFNLQQRQEQKLASQIKALSQMQLRLAIWQQGLSPAIEIVSALALSFSLYQGCSNGLSLDQFSAIAFAFYYCYDPIKRLGAVSNQYRQLQVMVQGINQILKAVDECPEPTQPQALPEKVQGQVDFNQVDFAYVEGSTVLHALNVHVPAGQIVALVGPSGSGKTSFINLICRFYDVNAGRVSLDGCDVRQILRAERTRHIALVSQFAALFRGSLYENILVGRPDASEEEVYHAAQLAGVDEFACEHPDGYQRQLDEGGSGLSGGQRQRVSIARAFLKRAPILILDEATSALDMKSEALIQDALEQLAQGQTTFIIAHRFSTIRMAQRILVFEEGHIVADGTHEELYQSSPLYQSLYNEQVSQQEQADGCDGPVVSPMKPLIA